MASLPLSLQAFQKCRDSGIIDTDIDLDIDVDIDIASNKIASPAPV